MSRGFGTEDTQIEAAFAEAIRITARRSRNQKQRCLGVSAYRRIGVLASVGREAFAAATKYQW
jgi:hypothetical protein